VGEVRVVMTLPPHGLEAQRAFHLQAGVDAIVEPGDGAALDAGWTIQAQPGELWWPRGGTLEEVLAGIPGEYDDVQAIVRPFVPVVGSDTLETMVYRLSVQGMVDRGREASTVRVASRAPEPRRPLRGWFPIEVLTLLAGPAVTMTHVEAGLDSGVIHRDTRPADAFTALARGEKLTFARPTVVEDALLAADVAALGEADAFRLRDELDEVESRLRTVEEGAAIRLARRLRRIIRRA
jgi:hypothetical protein